MTWPSQDQLEILKAEMVINAIGSEIYLQSVILFIFTMDDQ